MITTRNWLPVTTATQLWCCSKGCGTCEPRKAQFEYSRTEDRNGNLIDSKSEEIWVSHCCRADLLLWDEVKQDFVEWTYAVAEEVGK